MNFRYVIYFLILLIFSLFTIHFLIEVENNFEISFSFSQMVDYVLTGWIFALVSILTMSMTRHITQDYGRFLLLKAKTALKFNLYIIQVLVFLLWTFSLNFIISIHEGIHLDDNISFFLVKLLFSFVYGIVIILLLNGITVFRSKK